MRQGAPIISVTSSGCLSDFVPDIGVVEGPYILDNPQQFSKIANSDWFVAIKEQFGEKGITFLIDDALFGARNILADRPVRSHG